jgi:hypothetical protein
MTETTITEATPADYDPPTPKLNAALAKVQAEMPSVAKDNLASIPGKDGKTGYKYGYADLADCSKAILPLLGRHGLSFRAKPTLRPDGKFVLAYALKHESGEQDCGEYPLHLNSTPQALGGEITYARRYSLCAITGLAPGGDDDDAASAQVEAQHRGSGYGRADDSWRDQPPVNRAQPPANGNGHAPAHAPAQEAQPEAPDAATIAEWGALIDTITCQEDADKADAELKEIFKQDKITSATANAIRMAIRAKTASLGSREAVRQPDEQVLALAARIEEAPDIATLRSISDAAKVTRKASASYMREGKPVTISQRIGARRAELEAAMAGAS